MRSLQLIAALLGALALVVPAEAARAPRPPKPAAVNVSPSGAALHPGDTLPFTAVVVDKSGNELPGVPVTWKSSASSVVSVTAAGVATAVGVGKATLQAKASGKTTKIAVHVLAPATGTDATVAVGLKQVNHILVDDTWIYWTEVDTKLTRLRKMRKTGGGIYDLAVEPARTRTGIQVSYVQLQQWGNRIYFSRQESGFLFHWSIRSVSNEGGPALTILPNDTSVEPMLANAWKVSSSGRLIVALQRPDKIGLNDNVRLASWDPETTVWTPILTGQFDATDTHLIAADDSFAYVRGYSQETRITRILKVSLDGSQPFQTLLTRDQAEEHRSIPGATDGTNVYFWTGKDDEHRLVYLPVSGGELTGLMNSGYGSGLTLDGSNLYWAKSGINIVKLPVTGGSTTPVKSNVYGNPASVSLAIDDTSVYVAIVVSKSEIRIQRVAK